VHETDELIARVATTLRSEPIRLAPDFDARVMQYVREDARQTGGLRLWRWMTRTRTVRVSPLGALALAAGLAGVVTLAARRDEPVAAGAAAAATAPASAAARNMEFIFVNASASSVAIVGDFNDWEEGGSPLHRVSDKEGVWAITIPLAPGRYHYTFVVDGTEWVADPQAPRTLEDDFGRPNSVITVGDATT
jgi:hypothetical protein